MDIVLENSSENFAIKIANGFKVFREKQNLYKGISNTNVLDKFNMNVPAGSIYSLLGSSGCGKTTVMSCILGLCKLDKGNVFVMPSLVSHGYMPQETSLYTHFTIHETLLYFGTLMDIASVTKKGPHFLRNQIKFLSQLLMLPSKNQVVATLSGGQKRRLSLAVALMNDPQLLLLDEPTAGLDVLLRNMVWKHLLHLAATKNTTVILTTHYVDEAKSSSVIGIMRNGRMIAEDAPSNLLQAYQVNSIETLFLALCKTDESVHDINMSHQQPEYIKTNKKSTTLIRQESFDTTEYVKRITLLTAKNYKVMFRNVWMLFFVTTVPAICMLITCVTVQNDPQGIALGLVNDELNGSYNCPEPVTNSGGVCSTEQLSCIFLEHLPENVLYMIRFISIVSAKQAVKEGKTWGLIHFPQNYSLEITNRAMMGSSYFDDDFIDAWENSKITINLDQTNSLIYAQIMATLYTTLEKSSKSLMRDCGLDARIAEFPLQVSPCCLKYKEPIMGNKQMTSLIYVAPSLAIGILYFFPLTVAIRFINEKRQGTMERCIAGCTRSWEILISYAITEFTILIFQSIPVILILHFGFSVISCLSKLFLILTLSLLQGLSGLSSGLLLGLFLNDESQAAMSIMAIVFPSSFLSGILWPREGMPQIFHPLSILLPMTLPAEAMRSMMTRCWDFDHPNVWQGFFVCTVYILGSFILTVLLLNRKLIK